ncbi:MAG: hypothetical protein IDH49_14250 [Gammaproteobacteria bacterium]|nr:hypothetical protein [Gammaproteobacteria bacterium]
MKKLLAVFLSLLSAAGWAGTISVGDTVLNIPDPPGFVPLTEKMKLVYDHQQMFVAPTNQQFIAFVSKSDTSRLLKKDIPNLLARLFSVQMDKRLIARYFTKSEFAQLKGSIKAQHASVELTNKIEELLEKALSDLGQGDQHSQMIMLPIHEETDSTLAYSAFVVGHIDNGDGVVTPHVSVFTVTLVNVKGKALFLYSTAERNGLEWSQTISKQWSSSVVTANRDN